MNNGKKFLQNWTFWKISRFILGKIFAIVNIMFRTMSINHINQCKEEIC